MDAKINNHPAPGTVGKSSAVEVISNGQGLSQNGNNRINTGIVPAKSDSSSPAEDIKKLTKVVRGINNNSQVIERELHFNVDRRSGKTVIKIIDMVTKKVVRQIPNEEALNLAQKLKEGEDLKLFSSYI